MGSDAGREETRRYHEELYSSPEGRDPDAWLNRPAPIVMDALRHLDRSGPVLAYDLGAGVGRHTIPLARTLPTGSRVVAVDLLDTAIEGLKERAARETVADVVLPVVADLETCTPSHGDADLVVAVSTLEHVSSREAFTAMLRRWRDATAPGGVHVLVVATDRREIHDDGERPALAEMLLTSEETEDLLDEAYDGWAVHRRDASEFGVTETRGSETYELRSRNVRRVVQRPRVACRS